MTRSLREAVAEEGQPPEVAKQLQAWLLALSEGDASVDAQMQIYDVIRNQLDFGETDAD
ncbi:hypothetical protein KZ813_19195 [Sphingomonas sp. RHCKR7]|uniref:hypothetical protein n=1 Tax=Sphingomonas folli TaxID=2862497 RepID=UPI001CA5CB58|nr:hypothetical protein [Sphingomonas folli]MBW6528971.1 hypothetical protein [Sphingomonas folli]